VDGTGLRQFGAGSTDVRPDSIVNNPNHYPLCGTKSITTSWCEQLDKGEEHSYLGFTASRHPSQGSYSPDVIPRGSLVCRFWKQLSKMRQLDLLPGKSFWARKILSRIGSRKRRSGKGELWRGKLRVRTDYILGFVFLLSLLLWVCGHASYIIGFNLLTDGRSTGPSTSVQCALIEYRCPSWRVLLQVEAWWFAVQREDRKKKKARVDSKSKLSFREDEEEEDATDASEDPQIHIQLVRV